MTDWSKYIGIPKRDLGRGFDGADCWGLARLVYQHELGIDLPSYTGIHPCEIERAEIDVIMEGEAAAKRWSEVTTPVPFDLFLFRIGPFRCHVGVAINARQMLHVHRQSSLIERPSNPEWCKRLIGIYRHEARA